MRFTVLISLLTILLMAMPVQVRGEFFYYHFKDDEIQLNADQFNRYIKPQLRAILQEYYHLLRKFNPFSHEVIELKNGIEKLTLDSARLKEICDSADKECINYLVEHHRHSLKLEKDIHELRINKIKLEIPEIIDQILNLHLRLDEISLLNYRLIHLFEQMEINAYSGYPVPKNTRLEALQIISNMGTLSELILTVFLEKQFAVECDYIWTEFMAPIESRVINSGDMNYFISQLGRFDLALNSFQMKLSKSRMPTPQPVVQLIEIIHNRWNSNLRFILNGTKD